MSKSHTMKVTLRPVDDITPYERNPRKNDQAVDAVAKSIEQFGFKQPIVVDTDGVIVVGHTRWKAAKQLGLAKVPVHVAADLTPEQAKAYRVADNRTSDLSAWDEDAALKEIEEIIAGLDDDEAAALYEDLAAELSGGPSKKGDESKKGSTQSLGDIEHKIIVNCRDEDHQAELLDKFDADGLDCKAMMI